jgi:glutamyl-tRNA reductase
MDLAIISLNHANAPLELRERLTYTAAARAAALKGLRTLCREAVILDTCNRSEICAVASPGSALGAALADFACEFHGLAPHELQPHLSINSEQAAVAHLFAVASGLESLVVGETQILAQVHAALDFASAQQTCGPILSALFRHALRTGKRARAETHIARGSVSLSSLAIDRVQQLIGPLMDRSVLLIGTGKMSSLAAQYLSHCGLRQMLIANRTPAHAQALAQQVGGTAIALEQVASVLPECDVVFSATSSPQVILSLDTLAAARRTPIQPLCIVDLALPHDVDPRVADLPNVHRVGLEDLRALADSHLAQRRAEVGSVQAIVDEEVRSFWAWLQTLSVAPTIAALRARAEHVRQAELADNLNRFPNLTPHERRVIESLTAGMIGQLLHGPILRLKERATAGEADAYASMLRELFALNESHET